MGAVGYIRVSSRKQYEEGFSYESQKRLTKKDALAGEHTWVGYYEDGGVSGRTYKDRSGIDKLLKDARAGKFDMVIVTRLSRLGRSLSEGIQVATELDDLGIKVKSLDGYTVDSTTATGKLIRNILMAIWEWENEVRAEQSMDGKMEGWIKKGIHCMGARALGYDYDKERKGLTINEREKMALDRLFDLVEEDNGRRDLNNVAKVLNREGFRGKKGKPFTYQTVKRCVFYELYSRPVRMQKDKDGREIEDATPITAPQIIDKDRHDRIMDLTRPKLKRNTRPPTRRLFAGHLRCALCGERFYGANKNVGTEMVGGKKKMLKEPSYLCKTKHSKGRKACKQPEILMGGLDNLAWSVIMMRVLEEPDEYVERILPKSDGKELESYRRQEKRLEKSVERKMTELENAARTGELLRDAAAARKILIKIQDEIEAVKGELKDTQAKIESLEREKRRLRRIRTDAKEIKKILSRAEDRIKKLTWAQKRDLIDRSGVMIEVDWEAQKPKSQMTIELDLTSVSQWLWDNIGGIK